MGENDSHREEKPHSQTRPRLARKTVPEIGKEKFVSFYITFKQQIESWNVSEDTDLFKEYLGSLSRKTEAKTEYWNLRARHPSWPMKKVGVWLVKRLDKVEP